MWSDLWSTRSQIAWHFFTISTSILGIERSQVGQARRRQGAWAGKGPLEARVHILDFKIRISVKSGCKNKMYVGPKTKHPFLLVREQGPEDFRSEAMCGPKTIQPLSIFVSSLLCFLPLLFRFDDDLRSLSSNPFLAEHSNWSGSYRGLLAPSIAILAVSAPSGIYTIFSILLTSAHRVPTSRYIVMSSIERFIYLCGMAFNAAFLFFPSEWTVSMIYESSSCFGNASTILSIYPILKYLERASNSFTPITVASINFFVCSGSIMNSCAFLSGDPASLTVLVLYFSSVACIMVAALIFYGACIWSFAGFLNSFDFSADYLFVVRTTV